MNPVMNKIGLVSILLVSFAIVPLAHAQNEKPVVLAEEGEVISNSLPAATNYFVKKIPLGQRERAKIKAQGSFSPQVSMLKFFYGENAGGTLVGTVLFLKMETQHGMIEVGVALNPGGTVSNVVVTKATAETVPWIQAAEAAGVTKDLIGIGTDSANDPLKNVSESAIGAMPYFAAQVMATATVRAIVYYQVVFLPRLQDR